MTWGNPSHLAQAPKLLVCKARAGVDLAFERPVRRSVRVWPSTIERFVL
jgi:hypothetical protein